METRERAGAPFAIVTANYFPRTCGVGDNSMRLAQELARRGAPVTIVARAPAEVHEEAPEVPVVAVPVGGGRIKLVRALARAVDRLAPHTVLLQYTPQMFGNFRSGGVAIPWLARSLRARGRRVIVVAHELFTSWAVRPDHAWQALSFRMQLGAVLREVDQGFVTTERRLAAARSWARRFGADDGKMSHVAIGANALPLPPKRVAGAFRVGLFSSLDKGKRMDVALDAFAVLKQRVPGAELLLIGDWPDGSAATTVARAIAEHPAREAIRSLGRLTLSEVSEVVRTLDVFLFTRNVGAGTRSSVLPTPLGCGVPVVAVSGEDTDPVFVGDENIVFATALDGSAFASAILRLWASPALAERVAKGGARLYSERLAWPRIVDGLFGQPPPSVREVDAIEA